MSRKCILEVFGTEVPYDNSTIKTFHSNILLNWKCKFQNAEIKEQTDSPSTAFSKAFESHILKIVMRHLIGCREPPVTRRIFFRLIFLNEDFLAITRLKGVKMTLLHDRLNIMLDQR